EGIADEPEGYESSGIGAVERSLPSQARLTEGMLSFTNLEKAWRYTADGRLICYLPHPVSVAAPAAAGVYIVKMQHMSVIRSQKITVR
ncbi:MAG: hypothetical protein IJV24_04660, partial [Prevotella sp.]|nr:hypothetical protein [Prevotella sp.]